MSQELFSASVGEQVGSFLLAAVAVAAGLALLWTPPGEAGHLDAAAAGSTMALTAGGATGDKVIAVLPTVKPPDGLAGRRQRQKVANLTKTQKSKMVCRCLEVLRSRHSSESSKLACQR